jgi:hypothetical protein
MRNRSESDLGQAPAGAALEAAVRSLVDELRAARLETQRQRWRLRALAVGIAALLAALSWSVAPSFSRAEAAPPDGNAIPSMSRDELAAKRAELIAMLPAEKQRELESFEREVVWLSAYMHTWEQGQAGAVVALMLFKMAQSMNTMPSMEQQVRTMSGQMGALPAIVAELAQINAKMSVITASMDSTMGRAGRMMPWMPFAP